MLYVCVGVGNVCLHVFVHCVSSTGTRLGVVSLQVVPVTWNKRSVVGWPCDCVFVPPLSCDLRPQQGLRSAESL